MAHRQRDTTSKCKSSNQLLCQVTQSGGLQHSHTRVPRATLLQESLSLAALLPFSSPSRRLHKPKLSTFCTSPPRNEVAEAEGLVGSAQLGCSGLWHPLLKRRTAPAGRRVPRSSHGDRSSQQLLLSPWCTKAATAWSPHHKAQCSDYPQHFFAEIHSWFCKRKLD